MPTGHLRLGRAVFGGYQVATDAAEDEPAPRRPLDEDRGEITVPSEPRRRFDAAALRADIQDSMDNFIGTPGNSGSGGAIQVHVGFVM